MVLPLPILAGLLLFILPSITTAHKGNGNGCSCFRTHSPTAYFTNHIFRDFRNVGGISSAIPELITNVTKTSAAFATSDYFLSADWNGLWTTQSWNNSESMEINRASVLMINSPNNVYIEASNDRNPDYSTYLTLRTSRLPGFQSASEINSVAQDFHYLSMRFMARIVGAPGACAGFFTYLANDDPDKVQEADIEILTNGPRNMVQYTNQPSNSDSGNIQPQATRNSTNPGGRDWTLWNTYRYDWTPNMSAWYVNGESVANISYQAPRDPTQLMINMWSDGGAWTGNMTLYDEAYLQIQWMQFVYNTSGPTQGSENKKRDTHGSRGLLEKRNGYQGCAVVCGVDEDDNTIGMPTLLYNNTGMAPTSWQGGVMRVMVFMPLVLVGGAVFGYL